MNKLKGSISYCVGPIDQATDYGTEWRKEITPFLHSLEVGVFDPCNKPTSHGVENKHFVEQMGRLKQQAKKLYELGHNDNNPLLCEESNRLCDSIHEQYSQVVGDDLRMVDLSTFVTMYIDTSIHMCGSYAEQTHACLQRKPVLLVCKQGKFEVPGWLWGICQHETFFNNWEEYKDYVKYVAFEAKPKELSNRWKFFDYDMVYGVES